MAAKKKTKTARPKRAAANNGKSTLIPGKNVRFSLTGRHPSEVSGMFADDPTFEEFRQILREQREEDLRQTVAEIEGAEAKEARKEDSMVLITFPDPETQKEAIGFMLGRFSGTFFNSGEHYVEEAALAALANEGFVFSVRGTANEDEVAALRSAATLSLQRRSARAKRVAGRCHR